LRTVRRPEAVAGRVTKERFSEAEASLVAREAMVMVM
jgi:hypothetical protein